MPFFGKKHKDEENRQMWQGLEAGLKEVRQELARVSERKSAEEAQAAEHWKTTAEKLETKQQDLERLIRRQSDSYEDLLEELQETFRLEEDIRRERRENSRKEEALLSLIMCCREQMTLLEKQVREDGSMTGEKLEAWQQQFSAMAGERLKLMRSCGLEETGQEGEPVDYEIHEILSVRETEDPAKAGRIAQVYSPGLLKEGHVIKKARVAAYKLK